MDLLTIHAPQPLIAGQPAMFQLVYRPDVTLQPGGWFKVAFDYRGKDYRTQHVQCGDPAAPNYVTATATGDAKVFATTYRLMHYDQEVGNGRRAVPMDSESYAWRDRFGPTFSLNVEVVQVTLTDGTLGPGDELRLTFGTAESGLLLSCKSYARYPFWGLVDPLGNGDWRTVGPATVPVQPGPVALLLMVAPSLTVVDEPFSVRAAVFDVYFNPVAMKAPEVRTADPQVRPAFTAGAVPMSFFRPGLQRLHRPGGPWPVESNPSLCRDRPPAQRIFWGEIHGHTVYSDGGLRGPEEYYAFGRDAALLDFCAVSDHDFGIALHDPEARWGELVEAAHRFNEDGRFVTLLGWEISHAGKVTGRTFGHKNVYFRGDAAPFYNSSPYGAERVRLDYRDLEELWELLRGEEVLAIAHHPLMAATPGGMGTNWNNFHPPRERLVEVFSLWGCSEHLGTPQSVGTATAGNSVQAALARGYRLGFTAGSDGHDGRPASRREDYFPVERSGLTAVYAPELTRAALWDALWARHTYATTGVRMILDFRLQTDSLRYGGQTDSLRYTLGDAQMGDVVPVPPDSPLQERRSLWLRAIGTDDLDRVEIVRNNRVVETFRPDGAELAGRWEDPTPLREITLDANGQRFVFYYLRVTQSDGHRGWTSPVWVECAEGVVGN